MHDPSSESHAQTVEFPRGTEGLPEARKTELVELADGDEFELDIMPVKKQIGDATVRMLAYKGSVPGPALKVSQGSTITVALFSGSGSLQAAGSARTSGRQTGFVTVIASRLLQAAGYGVDTIWARRQN